MSIVNEVIRATTLSDMIDADADLVIKNWDQNIPFSIYYVGLKCILKYQASHKDDVMLSAISFLHNHPALATKEGLKLLSGVNGYTLYKTALARGNNTCSM